MIDVLPARPVLIVVSGRAHVGARVGSGPLLVSEACNLQLDEVRERKELDPATVELEAVAKLDACERCCLTALQS